MNTTMPEPRRSPHALDFDEFLRLPQAVRAKAHKMSPNVLRARYLRPRPSSLPAELIRLFSDLCQQHRSVKRAHVHLLGLWHQRATSIGAVEAYKDFPGHPKLPRGWSFENLRRFAFPLSRALTAATKNEG